ncbi:uncharacterized protein [Ptychodera flava]|uniref:uncharacterized protein isoform X1 n=1 Tax=Ptychodera flava TaxID=63121 RepID=UPI00396A42C3
MSICRSKWPIIVRYSLGILGYVKWENSNNLRRCLPCLLRHKGLRKLYKLYEIVNPAENGVKNDLRTACSICRDLNKTWRDGSSKKDDGRQSIGSEEIPLIDRCQYEPKSNQVNIDIEGSTSYRDKRKRSQLVQWIVSLTWLVIIASLMLGTWSVYIVSTWGRGNSTVHLLSGSAYVLSLVVVTLMRIVSIVYETSPPTRNWWVYALTKGNVLTRLNVLDLSRNTGFGYLSLAFALVCTLVDLSYQTYTLSEYPDSTADINVFIQYCLDLLAFIIGYFMFAAFCYEIHLLKCSLRSDMKLCLSFVKRNIENGLDVCRQRILATYCDFLKLHSLVSSWLVFQFSISVFKLSCHIYWNYQYFVVHTKVTPAILLNILGWCKCILFLLLPIFAVGGFSILYLLNDFKLDFKRMQRRKDGENWHKVTKILKTLDATDTGIYVTVVFSLLSVFLALNLGRQYGVYWVESVTQNETIHNEIIALKNATFFSY